VRIYFAALYFFLFLPLFSTSLSFFLSAPVRQDIVFSSAFDLKLAESG